MSLEVLNAKTHQQAIDWFALTCTSSKWCKLMVENRPYNTIEALLKAAEKHWQTLHENDIKEALAGHPMIGDITSLKAKYSHTQTLATHEQSGMDSATDEVFSMLKTLNEEYLKRHGFIFIICATGLSAEQMLSAISLRLYNNTEQELQTAAAEQLKITSLRITNALCQNKS